MSTIAIMERKVQTKEIRLPSRADQAEGSVALKVFPGICRVRLAGRLPTRSRELRSSAMTTWLPLQLTPGAQGLHLCQDQVLKDVLLVLATSRSCLTWYSATLLLGGEGVERPDEGGGIQLGGLSQGPSQGLVQA